MINTCFQCGIYHADKQIDPSGPFAICPECGCKHPFKQLPLLVVSGASGAGKTTVCQHLTGQVTQAVLLDVDILWRPEFNQPENNYPGFFETWLRVCKNIAQSGRPVVLFGAGVGVPENLENRIERRYFSTIHYLALTCSDEALSERLQARPAWRNAGNSDFIAQNIQFNNWFKAYNHHPAVKLIDTTHAHLNETAQQVTFWINQIVS